MAILALVLLLILGGALLQATRDRANRRRIARYQDWEPRLSAFLFQGETGGTAFGPIPRRDRWLFRDFLGRYQATVAGREGLLLHQLYLQLGVHTTLPARLRDRRAAVRAQAAQEIAAFQPEGPGDLLSAVLPLLEDPFPFVAHMAARTLMRSGELRFAAPVLAWVLRQHHYQRERILRVLEGFGPELLPWMEAHLPLPEDSPEPWVLYARLAGSHRHRASEPTLLRLLAVPHLDIQASAIKALIILADPATYPHVWPFVGHQTWEIRAQAARALGVLGGPDAIPELLPLLSDPVYEVRRNAAQSLVELGHAGVAALTWLDEDPKADRFARDMARERLEWIDERGHL